MKILGIDYGTRRIGLAISDPDEIIATPLGTIQTSSLKKAIPEIKNSCKENHVGKIVVGLPLRMDGSKGPAVENVEMFIAKLRKELLVTIETWDERLTSAEAEKVLLLADMSRAKRKQVRDKLAAQLILQSYLDSKNII